MVCGYCGLNGTIADAGAGDAMLVLQMMFLQKRKKEGQYFSWQGIPKPAVATP